MASEKRAQKFHTDDASLHWSGWCFWLVAPREKFDSTKQKHYQMRVVTRHQYGIAALVSETSFGGETSGSVAKCRLLSQATRGINSRFCSKTRRKMFLLVSVHHVGAHPGGYQHGVFKQISINLGKTFSSYISYTKYFSDLNLGEGLCIFPSFHFPDSISLFWFLLWSILNSVTLKATYFVHLSLFQGLR